MTHVSGGIVVGAAPSSGSTLVRVLLGRLDRVLSGGELNVIDRPELFDVDSETLRAGFRAWVSGRLARTFVGGTFAVFRRAGDFGWERDELEAIPSACAGWGDVLRTFFAQACRRAGAARWVEKTPGNVFGFHRAQAELPQAAFEHVVRDGRDAVASLTRRGHGPFRASSRWMFSVLAGLRQESLPRSGRIVYEQLVRDPSTVLRRVCERVGLPFEPAVTDGDPAATAPAVPGWRLSELGPVSSSSVGVHGGAGADRILAHLAAVRLSDSGHAFLAKLPGGEQRDDPSGLDVLRLLGYAVDDRRIPPITDRDRAEAQAEVDDYLRRVAGRGGPVRPLVPTRLVSRSRRR